MTARVRSIIVGAMAVIVFAAHPAWGDGAWSSSANKAGADTSLTLSELTRLGAEHERLRAKPGPRLEYKSLLSMCHQPIGPNVSEECLQKSTFACHWNTLAEGLGPKMVVYRRWVDPAGKPVAAPGTTVVSDWEQVGTTCLPDRVPGVPKRPSIAMIVNAFHQTRWAQARISTQPKGDVTLVNLKTFYKVNWSVADSATYAPGEIDAIDPTTMYGFKVEVRPKVANFVYHFGDGATHGPTQSPGGIWPDGDVVHTYAKRGAFTSHVEVTFGADYRINGGPWLDVPDTVAVPQPGTVVNVKEKRAVLVND